LKEYLKSKGLKFYHDRTLSTIGGCNQYRPDFLIPTVNKLIIAIECDEHQHENMNGDYKCEAQRMADIMDEDFDGYTRKIFIRFNPHRQRKYSKEKSIFSKITYDQRKEKLYALLTKILEEPSHGVSLREVHYMYYDQSNPHIVREPDFKVFMYP